MPLPRIAGPIDLDALALEFATGMASAERLRRLGQCVLAFPWERGGAIVEIGTYHGMTAVFLARASQAASRQPPVISIDPFERSGPVDQYNARGSYEEYCATIQRFGMQEQCIPVATFAKTAAPIIGPIGVLFVDGLHTFEACWADLECYVPKVMPEGWIFVDDYRADYYPGVVDACNQFFAYFPRMRVERHAAGYLVAQKC